MTEPPLIHLPMLGWREWVALPEFGITQIKAKIDTGARSSALHTVDMEPYQLDGKNWLMFTVETKQKQTGQLIECHAPIKDRRVVSDSGGHKQRRYVIETPLVFGQHLIQAEITLTNRDSMRFRMLLGRTAMNKVFIIDPHASYLQGKPNALSHNSSLNKKL
ncbi:MAG: ATP-dependent zinc protease [Methylococcaceae bacterium]|nr:ATP-dependent zinc protease [Methylococcaceae bacterium]